jgi:hypothetical protein
MHRWIAHASAVASIIAFVFACGSDKQCEVGACVSATSPNEAGPDVLVDGGADGPVVDPCVNTPTDPKCLDENTALFVSAPNGNDADATGATGKPFKTIGAALAKITAAKRRIYICDGTYAEDLALTTAHNGVSLFGGIDCTFKAVSANKPVIGATANPVKIDGTTGLALADVAVEAKDATAGSSIAVFVNGGDVALSRARLVAGNGFKGSDAVLVPFVYPDVMALKGKDASGNTGGAIAPYTCPGGATTTGGKGGDLGLQGTAGSPGAIDNKGGIASCGTGGTGTDGATGKVGMPGPGATTLGQLSESGWSPSSGTAGENGGPGQGGGGGYGTAGAGGGGGAGGCGGAGSPGGKGGGASIALATNNSRVTVTASVLQAKNAGPGGGGVVGQTGQPDFGGSGNRSGSACNGGNGGPGGEGTPGGGGTGGVSVGVLYKGTKPTFDAPTEQQIGLGAKGTPGAAAPGFTNIGTDGKAVATFESP